MSEPEPTRSGSGNRLDYNAVVVATRTIHDELIVLRIRPDDGIPDYLPGQYTTLGLRSDEPRIDGVHLTTPPGKLIRRAYSIGHAMVDDDGQPATCRDCDFLEFYIALVRKPDDDPPSLTPRLFLLEAGDRIFVDPKPRGRYTLESIAPTDNVVFAATGTGEAPHNAMLAELLCHNHQGHIASLVSARYRRDLAYLDIHRQLELRFANYRYIPLTTREAENTNADHPEFVGKLYLQDLFMSARIEDRLGWRPDPASTHVFLCGNPQMIGIPKHGEAGDVFPSPVGMLEILTRLGFQADRPRSPGNIHFEKYW